MNTYFNTGSNVRNLTAVVQRIKGGADKYGFAILLIVLNK